MTLRNRQDEALEASVDQLIHEIDRLVAEAQRMIGQTDSFFDELGIDREATKRYLESDKVSGDERRKALTQLESWQAELQADIRQARETFRQEKAPRRRPRGLKRVRI